MQTDEYRIRKLEVTTAVFNEKLKNNDEKIESLQASVENLTEAVKQLTTAMQLAKGGWKSMATLGGLVLGLASLISMVYSFFKGS